MKIKRSDRGLTFSFAENECFKAGTHYRYIVDTKKGEVLIIPDKEGKYTLSKKGKGQKPLVDLRNTEIKEAISGANYLEIEISDQKIVVHVINISVNTESLSDRELVELLDKSEKTVFEINKEDLLSNDHALVEMLTACGLFSAKTAQDLSYVYDVASLFSGAGLLDYPFHKDDSFDIKFAIDFDKSACETYKKNIGDHIVCMDIRDLDVNRVPDVDVAISGVCCQGHSNANRAGNITQDIQKRLLVDDHNRIMQGKKPLIFLIENVPQFLTKEDGKYLEKVLTDFSDYDISYSVVNDHELGGYSKRKRMLLIGSRKEVGKILIPSVELVKKKTVGDALRKVSSSWFNYADITKASTETQRKMAMVRPGHNYKDISEMKDLNRHSNVYRRLKDNEPSVTLTNWRKVCLMPPVGNRILSVAEAAAISGLDENFKLYGSLNDKQQQIGNGVTQAIATFCKSIIKNALYGYTNRKLGLT